MADWRIKKLKEKLEDGSATDEDKARLALMLESIGESSGGDLNFKVLFFAFSYLIKIKIKKFFNHFITNNLERFCLNVILIIY